MSKTSPFFVPDWQDRIIIPDVYPRKDDPGRPSGFVPPPTGAISGGPTVAPSEGAELYAESITIPGVRPIVYQRASNFVLPVTDSPIALQPGNLQCEAFLINVPSSSSNSSFFGFGSGVTSTSGIEVQPGIPLFFSPSNIREQWELQRLLEAICSLLGYAIGQAEGMPPIPTPGQFMAPRVVLNAHDYYMVNAATVTQNVAIMLFNVPEFQ